MRTKPAKIRHRGGDQQIHGPIVPTMPETPTATALADEKVSEVTFIFRNLPDGVANVMVEGGDVAEPAEANAHEVIVTVMVPTGYQVQSTFRFLDESGVDLEKFTAEYRTETFIATYQVDEYSDSVVILRDHGEVVELDLDETAEVQLDDPQWIDGRLRSTKRIHVRNSGPVPTSFSIESEMDAYYYQSGFLTLLTTYPVLLKPGETVGIYPISATDGVAVTTLKVRR